MPFTYVIIQASCIKIGALINSRHHGKFSPSSSSLQVQFAQLIIYIRNVKDRLDKDVAEFNCFAAVTYQLLACLTQTTFKFSLSQS